ANIGQVVQVGAEDAVDHAMTPIGLSMQAGPIGKAVILVLLAMSIWCWVLILEGWIAVARVRRAVRRLRTGAGDRISPLLVSVMKAGEEARRLHVPMETAGETRQRVGEAMRR